MVAVQAEDRGDRCLSHQAEHVDPEIVENQPGAPHRADVIPLPAGGEAGHDQPVRAREDGAGEDPDAEIEAAVLLGQMNAEVDRTEIAVEAVFSGFIEAGGRIDQKHSLEHVHTQHLIFFATGEPKVRPDRHEVDNHGDQVPHNHRTRGNQ